MFACDVFWKFFEFGSPHICHPIFYLADNYFCAAAHRIEKNCIFARFFEHPKTYYHGIGNQQQQFRRNHQE